MYRFILQRVSDTQRTRRVWNADDDLYDAHTFGGRITLYERAQGAARWMPAAYFDISVGWFQSFETVTVSENETITPEERLRVDACLQAPFECLAKQLPPEDHFAISKKKRVYVEGRVFINPENSWRVPIPVQTQEPPCGTSAVLTTTCATTEALA